MGDTSSHYGGCPCKQCNPPLESPKFDSVEEAMAYNKFEEKSEKINERLRKRKKIKA